MPKTTMSMSSEGVSIFGSNVEADGQLAPWVCWVGWVWVGWMACGTDFGHFYPIAVFAYWPFEHLTNLGDLFGHSLAVFSYLPFEHLTNGSGVVFGHPKKEFTNWPFGHLTKLVSGGGFGHSLAVFTSWPFGH